jgi:hypothetical protein
MRREGLAVRTAGRVLGLVGLVLAAAGLFVLDGISVEFPGIILGALGYYFGLRAGDRVGQILGAAAAILCVISMGISGVSGPPQ